jgi:hypothetical protein
MEEVFGEVVGVTVRWRNARSQIAAVLGSA